MLGSVLGSKQEANQMNEEVKATRGITSALVKAVQHPDFSIPSDGVIKVGSGKARLTRKTAEELINLAGLGLPGMDKAKSTLTAWAEKQPKPTSGKAPAERPKFGKAYRHDAIHNGQTQRRAVLVDTSPLFHEGGLALPKAMVSVAYETVSATTGTAKAPGTPEVKRIVITRTDTTKEDDARWTEREKTKAKAKANKAKRA